ncbi:Beta-amyrin 28-oxidase [Heracleum sosnowskyi]|uniref:Beta-amyrin 28-oxidase n=1 Tax=Heracleum sosnowskyi TaxID=360622 RepID=A0AAD8MFU8_9APIA|nr:Beta-amyrin 28-oxidase [Heracleum sosnowskyi]
MDTAVIMSLFPTILSILIIVISLFVYFFIFKKTNANLPPGSGGWPVVGENIRFLLSGPQKFTEERTRNYSRDVYQTSLFGQKLAVFCGPQGNKFIFANDTKLLTSWWPLSLRKVLFFPEFVQATSDEVTALTHEFMHDILKPEALKQYIPVMDSMAREHVELEWAGNEVVKVFPVSRKYTFDLACRLFMSVVDVEHVARLAKHFTLITSGLFSVPIDLPGTAYSRAIKGGQLIRAELMKIIGERRNEIRENKLKAASRSDFLSRMLLVPDENKKFDIEKEIANNIIGLLLASFDTTSTAVSFVLKYLAEHPHIYQEVLKEQMDIAKSKSEGELLKWEDIQKMRYSWNVVCETLRLIPPGLGSFREVVKEFTFAGFTIPKGWKTFWMVYTTHKNPKYFQNPETFDPSRFEGNGPAPYTFVPFGGGSRMCPGKEYARLEILVFLHNIVTKFKLEKSKPQEKIVFHSFPVPMEGLPLRIIPHKI